MSLLVSSRYIFYCRRSFKVPNNHYWLRRWNDTVSIDVVAKIFDFIATKNSFPYIDHYGKLFKTFEQQWKVQHLLSGVFRLYKSVVNIANTEIQPWE